MKRVPVYIVSYVRSGDARVRKFPTEGTMDRWIRKFLSDTEGDRDSRIDFVVINADRIQQYSPHVQIINYGE